MNVAQSAEILASTILTSLTFIIAIGCVLVVNNLISRYWRPVKLWIFEPAPTRFVDDVVEHKDIK